jgi:glutamate synthase (NADPH/NADH) small chain
VEKYITDTAWERGWVKPPKPLRELRQSVGIIGAGPAGLAAAERLRLRGYQVHVYDRHDRVGGLLIYGIPNFKLEKEVVLRRWQQYEEGGIRFHLDVAVGRDVSLAALRAKHDAVLIGTGVYKARDMAAPGIGLSGIVPALEFLTASNRIGLGERVAAFDSGVLDAARKHVTPRWIACAPRCARARPPSPASIAATSRTCPARCARCTTPRRKACASNGSARRKRFAAMAR